MVILSFFFEDASLPIRDEVFVVDQERCKFIFSPHGFLVHFDIGVIRSCKETMDGF